MLLPACLLIDDDQLRQRLDPVESDADTDADTDADGDTDADADLVDADGDGVLSDADCDDADVSVYPGSHEAETPGDGVDTDCDGLDVCTDLNCDGWPDLVVPSAYATDGSVSESAIFYGPFSLAGATDTAYFTTNRSSAVLARDLDGDGFIDVVFGGDPGTEGDDTYLYWGSATGPGGDPILLHSNGVYQVCAEDLDDDGGLEIVLTCHGENGAPETDSLVYWADRGYSVSNVTALPTSYGRSCAVRDLDADGVEDIVLVNQYDSTSWDIDSYIYWGADDYSTDGRTALQTHGAARTYVDDLDLDGDDDVFIVNLYSSEEATYAVDSYVYWNDSGAFSNASRLALAGLGTQYAAIADLDGGGAPEIITSSVTDGTSQADLPVTVWDGEGGLSTSASVAMDGGKLVSAADLDGDLDLDLVVSSQCADGATFLCDVMVFWNEGGFDTSNSQGLPGEWPLRHAVGDLDGDGWPDIFVANAFDGTAHSSTSYVYFGSAGGFDTTQPASLPVQGVYGSPLVVGGG